MVEGPNWSSAKINSALNSEELITYIRVFFFLWFYCVFHAGSVYLLPMKVAFDL